ncbi:MAG: lipase family protein, partial [Betaproteobacteria bacterium]|nr:lipase family protein [Betaproteobacteria bacterium]
LPETLSTMSNGDQTVWVTGHSLGGALAVLAAVKLFVESRVDIAGLYTFGQPPLGTLGFCSELEKQLPARFFRFVDHTDAVSDVPIFSHVGEVRYFDTHGSMHLGEPPWHVVFGDYMRAPRLFGGLHMFAAHAKDRYRDLLVAQLSGEDKFQE